MSRVLASSATAASMTPRGHEHRGSVRASHPAGPGSIQSIPEIFSEQTISQISDPIRI